MAKASNGKNLAKSCLKRSCIQLVQALLVKMCRITIFTAHHCTSIGRENKMTASIQAVNKLGQRYSSSAGHSTNLAHQKHSLSHTFTSGFQPTVYSRYILCFLFRCQLPFKKSSSSHPHIIHHPQPNRPK